MCQQPDAVLRFSFASWEEVLHAFVEPWVVALKAHSAGIICFHLPLSQATVCLGFFLTIFPRNALHSMHTKSLKLQPSSSSSAKGHAATHEENGRNHEDLLAPWVAFNTEAMHQPHVLCPCSNLSTCCYQLSSKTFSVKNQARTGKKSRPLLHLCCLSTWIVKMTATLLWDRFNILIFPDSGLCNDLELLEKGTPFQMQWYSVPFQHQNI